MNFIEKVFMHYASRFYFNWIPDKEYLKICFRCHLGKKLDLENPKTYNEKLQWLKLYNRRPEYTNLVDKYAVREYVTQKIGDQYLFPLLGVWDDVDSINFDMLPNQFVLKCIHDSGGIVICRDKTRLDIEAAKHKLKKFMNRDFYLLHREWPYKNVPHRVIAEKYMVDESGTQLKDYKFFCFDGEPKVLYIATDRNIDTRFDFFDMNFQHMEVVNGHANSGRNIKKPDGFEEMKSLARNLSKDIPHVRIDFYDINGRVYFGEMTFFHMGGFAPFVPESYDYMFGEWIRLPEKTVN